MIDDDSREPVETEAGWYYRPSGPRPDWQMPDPPQPGAVPMALLIEGDERWVLEWWADGLVVGDIPWPFRDDEFAEPADMIDLGFTVVELEGEE
jgi:hypothetical protein